MWAAPPHLKLHYAHLEWTLLNRRSKLRCVRSQIEHDSYLIDAQRPRTHRSCGSREVTVNLTPDTDEASVTR